MTRFIRIHIFLPFVLAIAFAQPVQAVQEPAVPDEDHCRAAISSATQFVQSERFQEAPGYDIFEELRQDLIESRMFELSSTSVYGEPLTAKIRYTNQFVKTLEEISQLGGTIETVTTNIGFESPGGMSSGIGGLLKWAADLIRSPSDRGIQSLPFEQACRKVAALSEERDRMIENIETLRDESFCQFILPLNLELGAIVNPQCGGAERRRAVEEIREASGDRVAKVPDQEQLDADVRTCEGRGYSYDIDMTPTYEPPASWSLVATNYGDGPTHKTSKEGPDDLQYYDRYYGAQGSVVRYRTDGFTDEYDFDRGENISVRAKRVDFGFKLDPAPPQTLETGTPFTIRMKGRKRAEVRKGNKDANSVAGVLESKQLGIDKEMQVHRQLVDGRFNYLVVDKEIEVTRTPDGDTPDRVVIEFGIPGTAAYVQYVYERGGG